MKEVKMFYLKGCPYCKKAFDFLDKLKTKEPRYQDINITLIEEREQADIANSYDYYYVPTFFVDEVKVFEGAPAIEDIKKVLDTALGVESVR